MRPDFLAIGHMAKDASPQGFRVGGAVTYAALTALRMGLRPAVVTSAGPDIDPQAVLPDVPVRNVPAAATTTFENTYRCGRRTQLIRAVGGPLTVKDVPAEWRHAPLVMLGPLAGELDYELATSFPRAVVVASIQGWLRQWDGAGRVNPRRWEGADVLPHVDAALFSDDDIAEWGLLEVWRDLCRVLVLTKGRDGADRGR